MRPRGRAGTRTFRLERRGSLVVLPALTQSAAVEPAALDAGEIAYTKPGKHRRIRLADLLDYSQRHTVERHEALSEMTREAERLGLEF